MDTLWTSQRRDNGGGGPPGPPFDLTSANDGLSVDPASFKIVLGNAVGGVQAILLDNREIPTAGFNLLFSGTGSVTIGDSPLNTIPFSGLFNNNPKISLAGGKPTLAFNIVDDGFIGGSPWGSANLVYRSLDVNAPYITDATRFGANVVAAQNYHYGTTGGGSPYVGAIEFWLGNNAASSGSDIPFSVYGKGNHFAGAYNRVPTVRASDSVAVGWQSGFNSANYLLAQPQLTLRAQGNGVTNTQLELSNAGASTANIENAIFFSVDNAPMFLASSYPSTKAVFVIKSTTNNTNGTVIQSYIASTNVVKGTNLVAQEIFSLFSEAQSLYLPTVSANFRLALGNYLTNDGYDHGKVSTFVVDAFNNPFYWRLFPNQLSVASPVTRDATDRVMQNSNIAFSVAGGGTFNDFTKINADSNGTTYPLVIASVGTTVNSAAGIELLNQFGDAAAMLLTNNTYSAFAPIGPDALGYFNTGIGGIAFATTNPGATVRFNTNGVAALTIAATGDITLIAANGVLLATGTALTNAAGASLGTLTNAPSAGNPAKWIEINDNGTIRKIPTWL